MRARSLVAALAFVAGRMVVVPDGAQAAPPPPATAPPGPSAADLAAAKKLFQTGLKLYNEGSYREALAAFRRANDIAPRASIQRNIAQCHRDLKEFAEAYDAYAVLLTRYAAQLSPADKRTIQRALDELALLTGLVRVTVTEPGATVALDGHDVGTTPLAAPIRANLGPHVVTVTKPGFEPLRAEVKLGGGDEARVGGALQPEVTKGHLVVGAPPGAKVEVFVDGTDVGPAPWEGDLDPGAHTVEGRGAEGNAAPRSVDIARRQRVETMLDITSVTGRVQVDSHTTDATISIDGTAVGKGVWEGTLPAGQHELSIEAPGYRPSKRAFLVHGGETFVADSPLEREGAAPAQRYQGIYSGLGFFGTAQPGGATNDVQVTCPGTSCDGSSPLGAGLLVRVGYAFGWLAVEGLALGAFDHSSATVQYANAVPAGQPHEGPPRTELYDFYRFGGGGAVGVRVANMHPHVRATAAAYFGLTERGTLYKRQADTTAGNNQDTYTSDVITYTAPLFVFDAGVLVGWENGAKFHVGGLVMVEALGSPPLAPKESGQNLGTPLGTPALQLASGPQVFVGPVIGFDFGL